MNDELRKYLQKQSQIKEPGLIVAEKTSIVNLRDALEGSGVQVVNSLELLFKAQKHRLPIALSYVHGNFKPIYDLVAQYSTGMLEIFDNDHTYYAQEPFPPLMILIDSHSLSALSKDYDLLSQVGLTIRL
jgi:hypothetical protein